MCTHWLFQFCSSRTVNPMIEAMDTWGAFLFYFVICAILLLFVIFFLPETAGYSLEQMDELFDKPWYKIGLSSSRPYRAGESPTRLSLEDGPSDLPREKPQSDEEKKKATEGGDAITATHTK